jgi:hypothetical protein
MTSRIVTYAHRYKRPPRKKKAAAITVPAIVTVPSSKRDRIRRREAADEGREFSPEEAAKVEAFLARMMRPRDACCRPGRSRSARFRHGSCGSPAIAVARTACSTRRTRRRDSATC